MLLAINDKIKGVLGYIVIGIITIPFTLWGIQSYLGDDSPLFVAKVNDSEISTQEFTRVLSRVRQNLQQKYNGKIPFEESVLKQQVVEQLINQRLLDEASYSAGFRISDVMLSARIHGNENFQSDGVFDKEYYDAILSSNGQTSAQFEESLRREMQVNQFQYSILKSGFATEKEVKKYTDLDRQTRDFSYVVFNQANTPTNKIITQEDISQYYKINSAKFMSPEQVKIEYIEVKSEDLSSDVEIDERKVKEMYNAYLAGVSENEERKARHILLTVDEGKDKESVKAQLQEIRAKIIDGASFDVLAKEHSKDPGSAEQGGDLDWVGRGQMVKPFETALFALNKGDISAVIESQFGFHLIRLDDVRNDEISTLAEKRESIVKELQKESAGDKFYDITENLAALAYENVDNLAVPSEVLGLEMKTTDFFTQKSGSGLAKHTIIRDSAFSESVLNNGENSEVIELNDSHAVVLRVAERVPAKLKPLDTVTAQIRNLLEDANNKEIVSAAANAARSKIIDGVPLDEVKPKGSTVEKIVSVNRRDSGKADPKILEAVFKMSLANDDKKSVEVVSGLKEGVGLVVLDKINTTDIQDNAILESNKQLISEVYANADYNAVTASIASNADIYRNAKVLEQ